MQFGIEIQVGLNGVLLNGVTNIGQAIKRKISISIYRGFGVLGYPDVWGFGLKFQ